MTGDRQSASWAVDDMIDARNSGNRPWKRIIIDLHQRVADKFRFCLWHRQHHGYIRCNTKDWRHARFGCANYWVDGIIDTGLFDIRVVFVVLCLCWPKLVIWKLSLERPQFNALGIDVSYHSRKVFEPIRLSYITFPALWLSPDLSSSVTGAKIPLFFNKLTNWAHIIASDDLLPHDNLCAKAKIIINEPNNMLKKHRYIA